MLNIHNAIILGGDRRQYFLLRFLIKNGLNASAFMTEDSEESDLGTLLQTLKESDIIILPIPVSADSENLRAPFSAEKLVLNRIVQFAKENAFVFGGVFPAEFEKLCKLQKLKVYDYGKREDFAVANAIPTAEGAVLLAMQHRNSMLCSEDILILGFGRIAKALIPILKGSGARISVGARKSSDLVWIRSMGCEALRISELSRHISKFGLIFNTVPADIMDEKVFSKINQDCLIIDLAGAVAGLNENLAENYGIEFIKANSLPGRIFPKTAGEVIGKSILTILEEERS